MSRRIDIELTSGRPDGTWTWRAAGAREPRGVVDGSLLFEGIKAGDVVRAEADFEIEGITILAVFPPKEKKRKEPDRLEILGSGRADAPGVTTQLVGKALRGGDRRGRDQEDDRGRPDRPGREPRGQAAADRPPRGGAQRDTPSPGRDRDGRSRRPERQGGAGRPVRDPVGGDARSGSGPSRGQGQTRSQAGRPASPAARPKSRRLSAGNAHRTAVLDGLAPEERVVAEQVLRGGVPAVRTAMHLEREKAAAEGRPAPDSDALITLAERLLPRLRTAEWHDRAEAAIKAPDEISLRDLRAVVTGADAARDDETRALAASLREALDRRLTQLRTTWAEEIRGHLEGGRAIRAVRLSGRPPEPSTRLPAELLDELAAAAGVGMSPDTAPDQWLAMLEAVAASPVRRNVKPAGMPKAPHPDVDRVARQQSGRVPALAGLLGITIPPPPGPRRRLGEGAPGGRPPPPPPPPSPAARSQAVGPSEATSGAEPASTAEPDVTLAPEPAESASTAEPERAVEPEPAVEAEPVES